MKRIIRLTEAQRQELDALLKSEKRVKIHKRLQFIDFKDKGKKDSDIRTFIPVTFKTLSRWTTLFLSGGFPGLCEMHYEGRRPGKLIPYKEAIKTHIDQNIVSTLAELKAWIKSELSVTVETSWLGEFCKKNSIFLTRK